MGAVALRKESVDRNETLIILAKQLNRSLSARRAWIEIIDNLTQGVFNLVALRKESVDRNSDGVVSGSGDYVSLSARRAWIEITQRTYQQGEKLTSLSARRAWIEISTPMYHIA